MDTDEELETVAFETNVETQRVKTFVEPEAAKGTEMGTVLKDPEVTQSDNILVAVTESPAATTAKEIFLAPVTDVDQLSSNEELMSIDDLLKRIPGDMMLPSILAAEPVRPGFVIQI
ncbi:mediator of DNA damage checkpoint protein 1 [Dorcoceras hygrometricum]|uniref:Mediator of DNA damage checkpoint protein 1 n=1 Tax=Dorcoceras hygrometricum TaxID=472368 RepID=A0A2Z6ZZH7_9LAMI|nr:mediator of DNA damage checkpoint protein 1 [Dorcoceras hygrometricum]